MTKSQLAEMVASKNASLSKSDIEHVMDAVFDCMTSTLARGERIEIRGMGSFAVRTHNAREGRNPKTGEIVSVPRRKTVHFNPGSELKNRVNKGHQ